MNRHIKTTNSIVATKIPLEVNAVLFVIEPSDVTNLNSIQIFDKVYPVYKDHNGYYINIETLHGQVRCSNNTYVIKAPQGDIYPHAFEEFHQNYNLNA